jgi:hypothetical protein
MGVESVRNLSEKVRVRSFFVLLSFMSSTSYRCGGGGKKEN